MRFFVKLVALIWLVQFVVPLSIRAQSREEQILLDDANHERTLQGLAPLKWDVQLAQAARQHASLIAQHNSLSHQLPGEPDPTTRARQAGALFSAFAENVAFGSSTGEIQEGWMKSPPHRKNLLDPDLNAIGIAVVDTGEKLFAVEDFSRAAVALSLAGQEKHVEAQLKAHGISVVADNSDARKACQQGLGPGISHRPSYMVRYTSSDIDRLPDQIEKALRDRHFHSAAVGACPATKTGDFTEYQVAVLFYQ